MSKNQEFFILCSIYLMRALFIFNFKLSLIVKENCIHFMHNINNNKVNIMLEHFDKTVSCVMSLL